MPSLTQSEFRLQRLGDSPPNEQPYLEFYEADEGGVNVLFCASPSFAEKNPGRKNRELLLHVQPDWLSIWPLRVREDRPDYLEAKYGSISQISLAQPVAGPYEVPRSADDVAYLLEGLPDGFERSWQLGLGLLWEYRFICEAVGRIPGVTRLVLHGGAPQPACAVDEPIFTVGMQLFREVRREIRRVSERHQRAGRAEKHLLAFNMLVHPIDAQKYPLQRRTARDDMLSDLVRTGAAPVLTRGDRRAAVRIVRDNAAELSRHEPAAMLELKADIERNALSVLTRRYEEMLPRETAESKWQAFFQANPLVLSLAFAYPAVVVGETPYFGGQRFDGSGARYGDFLMAAASTGNVAILEIKTPASNLLAKQKPYRDGVFAPSLELGGAISQVLDQRARLQRNFLQLRDDSGRPDIQGYSVRCLILVGSTPKDPVERKNFEHLRQSLAQIDIITFDELLGRLREILRALTQRPLDPPF